MASENKEVCMQCPRHCPITELRCPRGRAALEGQMEGQRDHEGHGKSHGSRGRHGRHHMGADSLEELMGMCGHYLHHRGVEENSQDGVTDLFAALNEEEQAELKQLLKKLLKSWEK